MPFGAFKPLRLHAKHGWDVHECMDFCLSVPPVNHQSEEEELDGDGCVKRAPIADSDAMCIVKAGPCSLT